MEHQISDRDFPFQICYLILQRYIAILFICKDLFTVINADP